MVAKPTKSTDSPIWCIYMTSDGYFRELSKAVEQQIKQEDEGKFRCKTCEKLFKATSFVEKHIANKHTELVKQLDEVCERDFIGSLRLNFAKDSVL